MEPVLTCVNKKDEKYDSDNDLFVFFQQLYTKYFSSLILVEGKDNQRKQDAKSMNHYFLF